MAGSSRPPARRVRAVPMTLLRKRRRRIERLGRADPRGGARQPRRLAREVGASREHRFDRGGLFGLACVECVGAEEFLDIGIREFGPRGSPLISLCFECLGDSAKPETQPRLGGAFRDAEHLGNLTVGLPPEVGELDGPPLVTR